MLLSMRVQLKLFLFMAIALLYVPVSSYLVSSQSQVLTVQSADRRHQLTWMKTHATIEPVAATDSAEQADVTAAVAVYK